MAKAKIFFTKLFHSEHWPTFLFYVPLIPYFIYKAIRARSLTFFLVVNPAIKYSGMGTESKFKTLGLLPEGFIPKSVLISNKTDFNSILKSISKANIQFPLIAKPDIGFRGYLVKKIDCESDLETYIKKNDVDIILQEYIDYKQECGLFYYKIPGENKGKITSITLKKFITVTGNGIDSLSTLILKDERAFLYHKIFEKLHQEKFNNVLNKGEVLKLTAIGNHSKGTQFIDGNHLIDKHLEHFLDKLTAKVPDFFYGRFDIKYENIEKLKQSLNFKILELNGSIAEPTHIYDSEKGNYFASLKCIFKHWRIMNTIARKNHDEFKVPYPKLKPYIKDVMFLRKYAKKIIRLNNY
ncbi:D-alanine--D-alanine ligase [Aureibaculum sp. 2210JD6-5]|uniref:D-alanine--D-alanine ligase n=1 Tax=Aureibaculum sp. 2210JD6-5 TaxID=3103957 RepID=UPI002AAC8513|nr:D-alanine--D-alanine ligase [Aureibaculum sp. 2210JD6-5]MDY7393754.1 D-alanine--D-alanine ligase [Aureibaculum sp. 2210JD6-5]